MNQKVERQTLQRSYTYEDGDYVMVLDLGQFGLDCDVDFDRGHLHITVFKPHSNNILGEFSVPIRERIEPDPEYSYNNGVITLRGKVDSKEDQLSGSSETEEDEDVDHEDTTEMDDSEGEE